MGRPSLLFLLILLNCVIICSCGAADASNKPLNNVFVIINDDLSPYHFDPNHPAKMPNLDRLAHRGTKFVNAHTSYPVCGPSRMSFMTGRFAESTKLVSFERFVMQVPGLATVAQYLARNHKYETVAFGKVFHEDHAPNNPVAKAMYQSGLWTSKQFGGGSEDGACRGSWFCTVKNNAQNGDWALGSRIINYLGARKNTTRPLLAFLGFRKPHLDVAVPEAFLDHVTNGTDELEVNEPPSVDSDGALIPFRKSLQRFECYYEIAARRVNGVKAYPADRFLAPAYARQLKDMRRSYFAALAFADANIQRIIDFVDASPMYAENTAIVYFSDHGFAMGEHGMFCKNALFDQQTRVPLIVVPAARESRAGGSVRTDPVSLVDLFPTIIELATGVNVGNKARVDESGLPLDGRSLVDATTGLYAFSQYPRCAGVSRKEGWQCVIATRDCGRIANKFMGFAVRTSGKKYVEWRTYHDVFTKCDKANWPGLPPQLREDLPRVMQIDVNRTGTDWSVIPTQRELFEDYSTTPQFRWGDWEHTNVLAEKLGDAGPIADAIELSAALKWRFEPGFATGSPEQPCSGNGYVQLRNRAAWTSLTRDPQRSDVKCSCLPQWSGEECEKHVSG